VSELSWRHAGAVFSLEPRRDSHDNFEIWWTRPGDAKAHERALELSPGCKIRKARKRGSFGRAYEAQGLYT